MYQSPKNLTPKLHSWVQERLNFEAADQFLTTHGSPLNLLSARPFHENFDALHKALPKSRHSSPAIYYAHKANKCAEFIRHALVLGGGVDVASESEWKAAIHAGATPERMIVTAQVKTKAFIASIIDAGSCMVCDALDDLEEINGIAGNASRKAQVALRFSGFELSHGIQKSRFGFPWEQARQIVAFLQKQGTGIDLKGLHFHLGGYSPEDRARALSTSLDIAEATKDQGIDLEFIDIGGGFPVSYLESREEWETYWAPAPAPQVSDGHHISSYPYWNDSDIASYVAQIVDYRPDVQAESNLERLQRLNLQLRCEPGRYLLQHCGVTLARIASVRKLSDTQGVIVCDINGTQLRPTKGDYLVDPLFYSREPREELQRPVEFTLVGRYCSENDRLYQRPISLNGAPVKGDVVLFPNTAGYHMHFLETQGHGFDLASNIFLEE